MNSKISSPELAEGCTVEKYRSLVAAQDREALADFIIKRFEERYLKPVGGIDPKLKSGFAIMAICCLIIESLEAFAHGWKETGTSGGKTFEGFFSRSKELTIFKPLASDFYKHIRCGILHQAETTGGWRIIRKGPILLGKTINATKFHTALCNDFRKYSQQLRTAPWESTGWKNFRKKMEHVCANAEVV